MGISIDMNFINKLEVFLDLVKNTKEIDKWVQEIKTQNSNLAKATEAYTGVKSAADFVSAAEAEAFLIKQKADEAFEAGKKEIEFAKAEWATAKAKAVKALEAKQETLEKREGLVKESEKEAAQRKILLDQRESAVANVEKVVADAEALKKELLAKQEAISNLLGK